MKQLSWKNGDLFERVKATRLELRRIQQLIDTKPFDCALREQGVEALIKYKEATADEEKLLSQKAKIEWLKEGDKNSAFYYKVFRGRMHKNRVVSICDDQGVRHDGDRVADQFVIHFQEFLGTSREVCEILDPEVLFVNKISQEEANYMVREVTEVEIKEALFDIGDNKALGPDGYSAKFFKGAWTVIEEDVCKAVKKFFQGGVIPRGVNATTIALVPKVSNPVKVSEFRPIACCTVLYKCISKVLTNRIKGVWESW